MAAGLYPLYRRALSLRTCAWPWLLVAMFSPATAHADTSLHAHEVIKLFAFKTRLDDDSYRDTLQLRYYHPLRYNDMHQATLRLDAGFYQNNHRSPPDFSLTDLHLANVRFTLSAKGAQLGEHWQSTFGLRAILPVGSSSQFVLAPQVGAIYRPQSAADGFFTDFSPLLRYLHGMDPKDDSAERLRKVEFYPTLGFQLSHNTKLRLWDEYGIQYNTRDGRWFVPIDLMLIHRLAEHQHLSVGVSKGINKSYTQYDWSLYGSLNFYF